MTGLLREVLDEQAQDVVVPRFDPNLLAAQGRRKVTQRRLGAVAAGVVAVALGVGFGLGTTGDEPKSEGPATGPDQAPTVAPYDVVPGASAPVPLDAGPWALTAVGSSPETPLAVVDLPRGFSGMSWSLLDDRSAARFSSAPEDLDGPLFRAIGYWSPTAVYKNPCATKPGHGLVRVSSVEEMAAALASQRLSTTTSPVPVTLDGHDGLYVELAAPTDLDITGTCTDHVFDVFECRSGTRWMNTPGMVDRYWIVENGDGFVLLATAAGPGVSPSRVEDLSTIVESAHFETE